MPKPIKKKAVKSEARQEDMQDIMARLATEAAARKKQLAIAGIAALAVLLIAAGAYLFNRDATERAALMEAEGYKMFNASYDAASLPRGDRLNRALASFKDANSTRPTAFRQYYIAATLFELGRYEDCLAALDEMDSRYSSDMRLIPVAKLKRALTYRRMGQTDKAISTLQEFNFIASSSLKDVAYMEMADILEAAGREDEAQQYYSLVLREFPNSRFVSTAQSRLKQPEGDEAGIPSGSVPPAPAAGTSEGGPPPFQIDLK